MALFPPVYIHDKSGSVTAGGTAQDVYSAEDQPEEGMEFYNMSDELLYIDFDRDAAPATGIPVDVGMGWISTPSVIPRGRLSVYGATTAQAYICKTF